MNDCLGKHGSHPEYCPKCLVSESCLEKWNLEEDKTMTTKTNPLEEVNLCFFWKTDRCVYRTVLTKAKEDCDFLKDGKCIVTESDLCTEGEFYEWLNGDEEE